jgi:hypothetical protein
LSGNLWNSFYLVLQETHQWITYSSQLWRIVPADCEFKGDRVMLLEFGLNCEYHQLWLISWVFKYGMNDTEMLAWNLYRKQAYFMFPVKTHHNILFLYKRYLWFFCAECHKVCKIRFVFLWGKRNFIWFQVKASVQVWIV